MNFDFIVSGGDKRAPSTEYRAQNQMTWPSVHIKKPSACQYVICVVNAATALK